MKKLGKIYEYTVFLVSKDEMEEAEDGDRNNLGFTNLENSFIYILETLNKNKKMLILFHELCHCFLFQWGVDTLVKKQEEMLCMFFGNAMKHLVMEYPKFKDWFDE